MYAQVIGDEDSARRALVALAKAQAKLAEALVEIAQASSTLAMFEANLRSGSIVRHAAGSVGFEGLYRVVGEQLVNATVTEAAGT